MRISVLAGWVALLALMSCGGLDRSQRADGGTAPAPPSGAARVVFLGDSYTVGLGAEDTSYVEPTAEALGWTAVALGESGTGYMAPGATGPYRERLDDVIAADPDVVIVQGSTNDVGESPAAVGEAAGQLYAALTAHLPADRIVVVGPLAPPGIDAAAVRAVRDALEARADAAGIVFVDPVDEKWLQPTDGLFADPIHPNDAGYRRMADELVAALRAEGF